MSPSLLQASLAHAAVWEGNQHFTQMRKFTLQSRETLTASLAFLTKKPWKPKMLLSRGPCSCSRGGRKRKRRGSKLRVTLIKCPSAPPNPRQMLCCLAISPGNLKCFLWRLFGKLSGRWELGREGRGAKSI